MPEQIHYCESGEELCQKLDKIHKPAIPNLPTGYAATIQELWEKVIKRMLPAKEVALAWHKSLMEYVKRPDAFYVLRGYSSAKALRRGFLSRTDQGYSFVYSDNDHAFYYAKMAMDGIVASPDALAEVYNSGRFPLKFTSYSGAELLRAFLKNGKNPGMGSAGYKLSHIYGLGDAYLGGMAGVSTIISAFFNGDDEDDWQLPDNPDIPCMRHFEVHEPENAKKYAIAAFLRLVHPFNYFLTPSTKRQLMGSIRFYRSDVGEHKPLIVFVRERFHEMYGEAYEEFEQAILVESRDNKDVDSKLDLHYYADPVKKDRKQQEPRSVSKPKTETVVDGLKVGQIAQGEFRSLLESGLVPDAEIVRLMDKAYAKQTFNLSTYPVLSSTRIPKDRYYAAPLAIKGNTYYMCSQWNEPHKAYLEAWIRKYSENVVDRQSVPSMQESEVIVNGVKDDGDIAEENLQKLEKWYKKLQNCKRTREKLPLNVCMVEAFLFCSDGLKRNQVSKDELEKVYCQLSGKKKPDYTSYCSNSKPKPAPQYNARLFAKNEDPLQLRENARQKLVELGWTTCSTITK